MHARAREAPGWLEQPLGLPSADPGMVVAPPRAVLGGSIGGGARKRKDREGAGRKERGRQPINGQNTELVEMEVTNETAAASRRPSLGTSCRPEDLETAKLSRR